MKNIRLDRFLCEMLGFNRKAAKELISSKRVTVDGKTASAGDHVTEASRVFVDGKEVTYVEYEYIMLNKPAGYVTATKDDKTTVMELVNSRRSDLFPVGRLDKDTEGLLLLTNDGDLCHRLLSPRKHVDKVYYADVAGRCTDDTVKAFAQGLKIDEEFTALPSKLEILKTWTITGSTAIPEYGNEVSSVRVTIHEGKFHQIKRMFAAVGMKVIYLKRLSMGSLKLDPELKPGGSRPLTDDEIRELKNEAGS